MKLSVVSCQLSVALLLCVQTLGQHVIQQGFWGARTNAAGGNGLLNGLTAYYKMDEGGATNNAAVDVVAARNLTSFGGPGSTNGVINTSRVKGATTDYFALLSTTPFEPSNHAWTIALWVWLGDIPAYQMIAYQGDDNVNGGYWHLQLETNIFTFEVYNNVSAFAAAKFTPASGNVTSNAWYFAAGWCDGAGNLGVMAAKASEGTIGSGASNTGAPASVGTGGTFALGARIQSGNLASGDRMKAGGRFDEVGFWSRKLSLTDIQNLYNGGAGLPYGSFTP